MSLALSANEFDRLATASRVLLDPFGYPSVDVWRRAALVAIAEATGASGGAFALGTEPQATLGLGMSDETEMYFSNVLGPVSRREGSSGVPGLDALVDWTARTRPPAWDYHAADRALGGVFSSDWYNEGLVPVGAGDAALLYARARRADVSVIAFGLTRPSHDVVPLLAVLQPSLAAGLDALDRLGAARDTFDRTDAAAAFFTADGLETHRTPAFVRLLDADPERDVLADALADVVRAGKSLVDGRTWPLSDGTPEVRTVTRRAAYRLRATPLGASSLAGRDAFAITLAVVPATLTDADLSEVYRLTARETAVTRLVAAGQTNAEIARTLSVSPHTVRHHLEAATGKLGLTGRGRAAVSARLSGLDGASS